MISIDFFPTILAATQTPSPEGLPRDGVNLEPLLRGESRLERDALFWHYPHYSNQGGFPGGAIRVGKHKLLERFEDGRVHLYDLELDPGEQHDLADEQPDRVEELRARLHRWYREVDAKFLSAKPDGPQPWQPDLP